MLIYIHGPFLNNRRAEKGVHLCARNNQAFYRPGSIA